MGKADGSAMKNEFAPSRRKEGVVGHLFREGEETGRGNNMETKDFSVEHRGKSVCELFNKIFLSVFKKKGRQSDGQ